MTDPAPVLCLGEAMVLCTPSDGRALTETAALSVHVAGAEANTASALAALGNQVEWFSRLGDDPFGARVREELRARGVDHHAVTVDPVRPTAVYFKDPHGGTGVHYYRRGSAAAAMSPADLGPLALHERRLVHVTGITAALSDECDGMVAAVIARPRQHRVSFDVNLRPVLWASAAVASHRLRALADDCDVVFVGRDEAAELWGCDDAEQVGEILPGPDVIVVKDSDREAVAIVRHDGIRRVYRESALRVEVREPVGAGDAFAAGFLDAWLRDRPIDYCLRRGHAVASRALLTDGDVPALDVADIDALTEGAPR